MRKLSMNASSIGPCNPGCLVSPSADGSLLNAHVLYGPLRRWTLQERSDCGRVLIGFGPRAGRIACSFTSTSTAPWRSNGHCPGPIDRVHAVTFEHFPFT